MQKKIIALAVAGLVAAPAFAQTNVQITGLVGVAYNHFKIGNASATRIITGNPVATENRLDDQTSRFTLKGTEDLGNGMSAYFQIENRVSSDTRPGNIYGNAQGLADGETFVGLKHKNVGSIGFGKFAMHYHETLGYSESFRALNTQAYSIDVMGGVNGSFIAFNGRASNTMKYDTPNWGGFSAKVYYSFNPAGNEGTSFWGPTAAWNTGGATGAQTVDYNKGGAWSAAARYMNGPINAYFTYFDYDVEGRAATARDQTSWKMGGDYKFPFGLKVGLHYDNSKIHNFYGVGAAAKRTAWMLPVSYSFGPNMLHFTFSKAGDVKGKTDTGVKKYVMAYDYALSRRTYVGASYVYLKNDKNGTTNLWLGGISTLGGSYMAFPGESARQLSMNVTHFF